MNLLRIIAFIIIALFAVIVCCSFSEHSKRIRYYEETIKTKRGDVNNL